MKRLLLIVNPRAGKSKSLGPLYDAIARLSAGGYLVYVRETKGPGDATRGGHIGKIPLIVPPHIQGNGRTLGDDVRSQVGRRGDVQGGGKVVCAAGGQVAQRRLALQLPRHRRRGDRGG